LWRKNPAIRMLAELEFVSRVAPDDSYVEGSGCREQPSKIITLSISAQPQFFRPEVRNDGCQRA
jgi:hypothetical protein